jgi:hypothetical protein
MLSIFPSFYDIFDKLRLLIFFRSSSLLDDQYVYRISAIEKKEEKDYFDHKTKSIEVHGFAVRITIC